MTYRFEFDREATQFADELGANNWGGRVFYIYCDGPQPVLMGMTLQDRGFYVKNDIEAIENFSRISVGRVTAAVSHETDPSLFVLRSGSSTLNVEKRVRLRNCGVGGVSLFS